MFNENSFRSDSETRFGKSTGSSPLIVQRCIRNKAQLANARERCVLGKTGAPVKIGTVGDNNVYIIIARSGGRLGRESERKL